MSHLHPTLRVALLIKEFRRRIRAPVRLVVGAPIASARLEPMKADPKKMMDFLRRSTYELSPGPVKCFDYGYEFEDKHKA
jgi:hypothetical protein